MKRIKSVIMKRINLLTFLLMWLMMACGEENRWQYATDNIPPGQVSNVEVENVPGGSIITYTVPSDDDLLYVKAVYRMSDGTQVEQKSSATNPKIIVEGLGRSKKQTAQLICGDRSGNESEPYPVEIEPLDATIYEIKKSIEMFPDYGGILLTWSNPLKTNTVFTLYVRDEEDGTYEEVENIYTASEEGKYNLRGFPAEERTFAVCVRDRWRNRTDTVSGNIIPLFEEQMDRRKFVRWNPAGIPYLVLPNQGWEIENLWNGMGGDQNGWSSSQTHTIPQSITFDMGQLALLNRIKVFQRTTANQLFSGYNVKRFQLWASPHTNVNADFATWLFMGDFTSVKPSGLPDGQLTEEDNAYGAAGEDYMIQENRLTPVRYIRVYILSTHGGGMNVAQFCEIDFFGQIVTEEDE